MTTPSGLLDFFALEASEYIQQLDLLVSRAAGTGPDADALQRAARALRGSATMARLQPFADVAAAMERVGRGMREGALPWTPALASALVAAVDDLKILVHGARSWGDAETARATARAGELSRYAPVSRSGTPSASSGGGAFLATEANNIAAGLELLITRPADPGVVGNVLGRVRTLRGVAAIRDLPPLPEALEAAEHAAHPLELGRAALTAEQRELLDAAAALLRAAAVALQRGESPAQTTFAQQQRFSAAVDAWHDAAEQGERIVPVTELFFEDAGPHVVSAAPHPPTTPDERFRMEIVSHGEHLRRLVTEAAAAADGAARERYRRELRRSLRDIRMSASSFGESAMAAAVDAQLDGLGAALERGAASLAPLAQFAELLSSPAAVPAAGRTLDERLSAMSTPVVASRSTPLVQSAVVPGRAEAAPAAPASAASAAATAPTALAAPTAPTAKPAPTAPAAPTAPTAPTPAAPRPPARAERPTSGSHLAALLDVGLTGLRQLESTPLAQPAQLEEQPPVPIQALLYRGRSALQRAIEVRESIRQQGGAPDAEALDELFDLLDMALVD